jgi:hypothetical protein
MIFFRFVSGMYFLFRMVGWVLYTYQIELSYMAYSFLMMLAFLWGAIYSPKNTNKISMVTLAIYAVAIGLTLPHALYDLKIGFSDMSALQSGLLRVGEIIVLIALSFFLAKKNRCPTSPLVRSNGDAVVDSGDTKPVGTGSEPVSR